MKLKINNVAKIEAAELDLLGITVIAGKNNTGKSTVGKTIFSVFNSLVNIEEKIVKQKENLIYQMLGRKSDDLSTYEEYYSVMIPGPILRRYARELVTQDTDKGQRQILEEYLGRLKNKEIHISNESDRLIEEIDKIKHMPIDRLTKSVVSAYFK